MLTHSRCPDFYRKEKTGFLKIRSEVAGAVRVELTSTVLETAVLPLNYAPIELTSDIIARYFLILQALFLLFYTNLNRDVRVVL